VKKKANKKGQAVIEYIMLVVMIAVTIAVAIRNTNVQIYLLWTSLARQVAKPCATCDTASAPDIRK
jgi:Flp pilus assembly pilin Flp